MRAGPTLRVSVLFRSEFSDGGEPTKVRLSPGAAFDSENVKPIPISGGVRRASYAPADTSVVRIVPPRAAARSRCTRSRRSACCSNAIRSAAATTPWVGRTQAVGHRVIPLDRINSATASRYLSASLIQSSMFHTRAEGSVSQSLWLHLGISPEDPREDRSNGRASRRFPPSACALLLSQSLRNELVSKMFDQFRSLESHQGCSSTLLHGSVVRR